MHGITCLAQLASCFLQIPLGLFVDLSGANKMALQFFQKRLVDGKTDCFFGTGSTVIGDQEAFNRNSGNKEAEGPAHEPPARTNTQIACTRDRSANTIRNPSGLRWIGNKAL